MLMVFPLYIRGKIEEFTPYEEGTEAIIDGAGIHEGMVSIFLRIIPTQKQRCKLRFVFYEVNGVSFSGLESIRPIGTGTTRYSDEDETLIVYEVL
ncbi:MAG: hypothetical protein LBF15_01085 [Candidatus Peribacteria bacterium]|jgi:hypothetical protein|nr:hypothetical protein [Candidatus Peribacteria bacterium]